MHGSDGMDVAGINIFRVVVRLAYVRASFASESFPCLLRRVCGRGLGAYAYVRGTCEVWLFFLEGEG